MNDSDLAALKSAMLRTCQLVRSVPDEDPGAPALEPAHYELLDALADAPQRISDLADGSRVEMSTVSRRVSRLVALGLVEKGVGADDRRVQVVRLTELGDRLRDRAHQRHMLALRQVVGGWDEADQATLARLANRMADQLDVMAGRDRGRDHTG